MTTPPCQITVTLDASQATPEQLAILLDRLRNAEGSPLRPVTKVAFTLAFWNRSQMYGAEALLVEILKRRPAAIVAKVSTKTVDEVEHGASTGTTSIGPGLTPLEEAIDQAAAYDRLNRELDELAAALATGEPVAPVDAPEPPDLPLSIRILRQLEAGPQTLDELTAALADTGSDRSSFETELDALFRAGYVDPDGGRWYAVRPEADDEDGE